MPDRLPPEQLEELKLFDTPTISNAIERFNVRPRNEGFMSSEIKCMFPDLGRMVGYAATATIMARQPAPEGLRVSRHDYWDYLVSLPAPRVVVIQDLDNPPAVGSFWGEVNGNIHKALGCIGTVTNGGVRDLDEVHALGFHFFACAPIVSHAYVHLVQFNVAVEVGGVVVRSGDLIHADKHGAITIPHEIAADLAEMCREVQRAERSTISFCKSPDFSLERLKSR
jgi:regulator of RNase E activity RraA